MVFTPSGRFAFDKVDAALDALESRCKAFADGPGEGALAVTTEFSVEARYPHQIWEIEVPIASKRIGNEAELNALKTAFHETHKAIFEISDPASEVEFVTWRAKVSCRLREHGSGRLPAPKGSVPKLTSRKIYFAATGWIDAPVARFEAMKPGEPLAGPAVVESSFTTVVVDPGTVATRTEGGGLQVTF
jgi:N-methylhydantoinase A